MTGTASYMERAGEPGEGSCGENWVRAGDKDLKLGMWVWVILWEVYRVKVKRFTLRVDSNRLSLKLLE